MTLALPPQADLLWDVILGEEITHCAAGLKWFTWLHEGAAHDAVLRSFHDIIIQRFYGNLKVCERNVNRGQPFPAKLPQGY